MSRLDIKQIPVLNDNYVYLAHCPETGATAGWWTLRSPAPCLRRLDQTGWTLTAYF